MTDPLAADTAARPAERRATFMSLMTRERWIEVARILLTGLVAFLYWRQLIPVPVLWVAVAVGLYRLVKTGLIDLFTERKIGTELFVTVATIFALVGGEEVAGSVLMVIILIAEFIADLNTDRARASIQGLIGAVPTVARVRENGQERVVPIAELHVDDVVLVRAGDSIPVDGTVVSGDGAADEASVTGESVPKDKSAGSRVFAGTILKSGALDVRTEAVGEQTTFARIVALVEDAEDSRAPVQKLADKVAAWLIPLIIVFLVVVFLVTRDVSMIVTLMIFTSPAELALATPMVIIAAIARAARSGILIKGGIYLESLARATTVVFDKTGTLTVGSPKVSAVRVADASVEREELLRLTAGLDRRSSHPLAEAIVAYVREAGVEIPEPTDFQVVPGRGVTGTVDGRALLVGNAALLTEAGIDVPPVAEATTIIHVAADGRLIGSFELEDQIRPGAKEAIAGLRVNGVKRIPMLTGDNAAVAGRVADSLGIDEVYADLLPEDKVGVITQMQARGERGRDGRRRHQRRPRAGPRRDRDRDGCRRHAGRHRSGRCRSHDRRSQQDRRRARDRPPGLPHHPGKPVRRRRRRPRPRHHRRPAGLDRPDPGRHHPPRSRHPRVPELHQAAQRPHQDRSGHRP
ncbi:heavy metal translocating P-type ATPase [Microbacterium luteum]|uniref:heavy metal translocating P-type ATPase n=1 Tax=Microbacterium TaxID=33882 RepID=UPI001E5C8A69|nr:heavy metal translocating P-type ATPase [Microbacterium luteum]